MTDYLYHKVSEKEKSEILKQAKRIMDNFAKALEKVEKPKEEIKEEKAEKENTREETQAQIPDKEFRKTMMENAKEKDENCIIAEKKKW